MQLKPGAELKRIPAEKTVKTSVRMLERFCNDWNRKKYPYTFPTKTCHKFSEMLTKALGLSLSELSVENLAIALSGLILAAGVVLSIVFGVSKRDQIQNRE